MTALSLPGGFCSFAFFGMSAISAQGATVLSAARVFPAMLCRFAQSTVCCNSPASCLLPPASCLLPPASFTGNGCIEEIAGDKAWSSEVNLGGFLKFPHELSNNGNFLLRK